MSTRPAPVHAKFIAPWTDLKKVRQTGISRFYASLAVLIPLLSLARRVTANQLGLRIPLPFDEIVLYFSSLCYYVGCLVFDLSCPRPIRDFSGRFKFGEDWIAHWDRIWGVLESREKSLRQSLDEITKGIVDNKSSSTDENTQDELNDGTIDTERLLTAVSQEYDFIANQIDGIQAVKQLDRTWEHNDRGRPLRRLITQALFLVAASMACYVSFYDTPRRVLQYLN